MKRMAGIPRPSMSAVRQTVRFMRDPFTLVDDARRECGDLFCLHLIGLGKWVFLCSPRLIKEMFKARRDVLAAGEVNVKQVGFIFGRDALFSLDGSAHRERRQILYPHFNGRRVQRHIDMVRACTERICAKWPEKQPFSLLDHSHRLSLDVLMNAMLSDSGAERVDELASLFDEFAEKGPRSPIVAMPFLQVDLGPYSPWGKFLRLRKIVQREFAEEIATRIEIRETGEGTDIASELAATQLPDGGYLSPQSLLEEILTLIFAGHETTGHIMTWTLECLLSHPQVLAKVREELGRVLGDEPVDAARLAELEYLEAVINEAIRFRPIAPMAGIRLVKQPFEIDGYVVPEGMLVAQCFSAMARREDLFPHPERFDPTHFYRRKLQPFEWNPFGGSTRMCIGRGLAEMELKVALATVLQQTDLRLVQSRVRAVRTGIFFAPDQGLRVVLDGRFPSSLREAN